MTHRKYRSFRCCGSPGLALLAAAVLVPMLAHIGCSDDSAVPARDAGLDDSQAGDASVDGSITTDLSVPLVETDIGPIRGSLVDGVATFLGIPYAAPPTGDLRWKPPRPHDVWTEVRDATAYGASCSQIMNPVTGDPKDSDPGAVHSQDCPENCQGDYCCVGSEDCLFANVWTTAAAPNEKRPVMVWIHGGGWNNGSGSLALYRGTNLAKLGAVVVTFNYRLGPLGYLAHPGLTAESSFGASGDYGSLDQIRLLEWVRDNIAQFGGDPDNVTIFGESAGASNVCDLVASPLAQGMFDRAVLESAACTSKRSAQYLDHVAPISGKKSAEDLGLDAAQTLGCAQADNPVACMRNKTPGEIFSALKPATGTFMSGPFFRTIVDGHMLPDAPMAIIEAGRQNKVPVIGTANQNEEGLWRMTVIMPALGGHGYTLQDANETVDPSRFASFVSWAFGAANQQVVMAIYPKVTTGAEAVEATERLMTDVVFVCPLRRSLQALSQGSQNVFMGSFTRVPPNTIVAREKLGAIHSSEIKYVFGTLDAAAQIEKPLDQTDSDLSDAMTKAWFSMAKLGDPGAAQGVDWPAYDTTSTRYLEWNWPAEVHDDLRKTQCDYIDAFRDSDLCRSGGTTLPLACLM